MRLLRFPAEAPAEPALFSPHGATCDHWQVSFAFNPSYIAFVPGGSGDLFQGALKIELGPKTAGQIDVIYVGRVFTLQLPAIRVIAKHLPFPRCAANSG